MDDSTDSSKEQPEEPARRGPGRPPSDRKELLSLRYDRDLLDRFRNTGPGWQTRMNLAARLIWDFEEQIAEMEKSVAALGSGQFKLQSRVGSAMVDVSGEHVERLKIGIAELKRAIDAACGRNS